MPYDTNHNIYCTIIPNNKYSQFYNYNNPSIGRPGNNWQYTKIIRIIVIRKYINNVHYKNTRISAGMQTIYIIIWRPGSTLVVRRCTESFDDESMTMTMARWHDVPKNLPTNDDGIADVVKTRAPGYWLIYQYRKDWRNIHWYIIRYGGPQWHATTVGGQRRVSGPTVGKRQRCRLSYNRISGGITNARWPIAGHWREELARRLYLRCTVVSKASISRIYV